MRICRHVSKLGMIGVLSLFTSHAASAEPTTNMFNVTGEALLEWCSNSADPFDYSICTIYIIGVSQGLILGKHEGAKINFCPNDKVNGDLIKEFVIKALRETPSIRKYDAALVIKLVMETKWWCTPPTRP